MQQLQPPSVGRMVHYTDPATQASIAAIVVAVDPVYTMRVTLFVMDPRRNQAGFLDDIEHAPAAQAGHWSWPPHVGPQVTP